MTSEEISEVSCFRARYVALVDSFPSQALQLPLLVSHTSHIQACSARSASTTEGDQRIWDGLVWVVKEVAKRVYYGTGGGMPMASEVHGRVESSPLNV